jgi:hypothetical protein
LLDREKASHAALFVISASILTLEVLQTRLFSYALDTLLLYAAISVALLGMGAAGTALSLWQGWRGARLGTSGAVGCVLFAVTVVVSHLGFSRTSEDVTFGFNALSIGVMALMAVPYLFGGAAVTVCLSLAGGSIHRAYFVNLLGSAVGCFVAIVALPPLGAPGLLVAVVIGALLAALLFVGAGAARSALIVTLVGGVAVAPFLLSPARSFGLEPDPTGHFNLLREALRERDGAEPEIEQVFGEWNAAGRIEIHRFPELGGLLPEPIPLLFYSQDGSAASMLFGAGDDPARIGGLFERSLYGAGYKLRGAGKTRKVLVIGLGGGPDILGALYNGAQSITGVEVNSSSIAAVRGPFAEFVGHPYQHPAVRIVHMDGRSFVRSSREQYDLLVMSGVDTKAAAQGPGSLAISENLLYTVESFGDYLERLAPGGHIALLRFMAQDRIRLTSIGVAALRARGVERPERHFAVLEQGHWTTVIIGRDPIEPAQHQRLRAWTRGIPRPDTGIRLPHYDLIGFPLSMPPRVLYPQLPGQPSSDVGGYLASVVRGDDAEILARQPLDLSPTTDNRPFFFDFQSRARLFSDPLPHYRKLGGLMAVLAVLAIVAIVAPIPVFLREAERTRLPRTMAYFLSLGIGFMLLELGFMQKLVLLLGHQSYAITVVLATILVAAGVGSRFSARYREREHEAVRRLAVPAILVLSVVLMFAIDPLSGFAAAFPLAGRIGVTVVLLAPLGFVLGMPFPGGLSSLGRFAPTHVPWAIGANGFGSVLGSAAALLIALLLGYRMLILLGLGFYVLAALTFPSEDAEAT